MQTTQRIINGAPRCWLDLIPSEVRKAIASRVCDPQYSDAGLYLAQTSQEQEDAVADVLSNKVNLDAIVVHLNEKITEWAKIFQGRVRNIELKNSTLPSSYFGLRPYLKHLFSSPTLYRAEIPDESSFIRAISGLSSLRELKVIGLDGAPENAIDLLESLKTLNLFKLEIECQGVLHDRCAIHGSRFWNDFVRALPEHCPNLHTFRMQSNPPNPDNWNALWNMLPRLKALRHVTVDQKPPPEALDTLRNLESVYIHDIPGGVIAAREISRSVTGLTISSCLRRDNVDVLSQFCRLEELDIEISPGTENQLLTSVQTMPELRSLNVKWGPGRRRRSGDRVHESIRSGVLLNIVQSIPKLEKVEFLFVRIISSEVNDILMCVGKRLRHFGISVDRGLKTIHPYRTLDTILWALYTYNPNIESVNIRDEHLRDPRDYPQLYCSSPLWLFGVISKNESRDLMILLKRLQCRNPALEFF